MAKKENKHSKTEAKSEVKASALDKLVKYLPLIIILGSTLAALFLVAPLFKPGIPMNIDLPGKYERSWCYQDFVKETGIITLPTTMCHYKNAGDPLFQGYPPLFYILVSFFSMALPLILSFKLVLVITYFLLPLSAFLLLNYFKKPLAGAFAYTFLLLEHGGWHLGGFEQIFLVGMSSNALSSGFFVLALLFTFKIFNETNYRNIALASIFAAMTFLAHGVPFMLLIIISAVFVVVHIRKVMKNMFMFALYPVLIVMINSFWLLPYFAKSSFFFLGRALGGADKVALYNFLWQPINKVILIIGIIGVLALFISKNKEMKMLGLISLIVPFLWLLDNFAHQLYLWMPLTKFIILIRLHSEFRTLMFISAALLLATIALVKFKSSAKSTMPLGLVIALIIFSCIVIPAYTHTSSLSKSIMTSEDPAFKYQQSVIKEVSNAKGRVLVQDTLYSFGNNPQSYSHSFTIASTLTHKEFLGRLFWYYYTRNFEVTEHDQIFYFDKDKPYGVSSKLVTEITQSELNEVFNRLNIQYVIAYSPNYLKKLENLTIYKTAKPWVIFYTGINSSYFDAADSKIVLEDYRGLSASVDVDARQDTSLLFKVQNYPNWQAKIDGVEKPIKEDTYGFMKIDLPKGRHRVEFKYVLMIIDWASYMPSLIGLALCVYLFIKGKNEK